jgi:hypothetical protein
MCIVYELFFFLNSFSRQFYHRQRKQETRSPDVMGMSNLCSRSRSKQANLSTQCFISGLEISSGKIHYPYVSCIVTRQFQNNHTVCGLSQWAARYLGLEAMEWGWSRRRSIVAHARSPKWGLYQQDEVTRKMAPRDGQRLYDSSINHFRRCNDTYTYPNSIRFERKKNYL